MRLATCVALEFMVGASLATGIGTFALWGTDMVHGYWEREARAAQATQTLLARQLPAATVDLLPTGPAREDETVTLSYRAGTIPHEPSPVATTVVAPEDTVKADLEVSTTLEVEPIERPPDGFDKRRDQLLLEPLRDGRIKRVRYNRGGSSISLRIDFGNGARGAFKPNQAARQTIPRKEIAAYRIDRLLGFNAVPPAIGRAFPVEEILNAVEPGSMDFMPRLVNEMHVTKGLVIGELSWWIPVIEHATVQGYEVDSTDGVVTWRRHLTIGRDIPENEWNMVAQISSMVLFDLIINNPDRFSGANVRMSADGRVLYFMDNTLSFGRDPQGHRKCNIYLNRVQKFSRSRIESLRAISEAQLRETLADDRGPFAYLLTDGEIKAVMKRIAHALTYVDGLIAEHGEDTVLVFP